MLLSQNIPTKEEFDKFITVIERLSSFEAEHRCIRGWGMLNEADLPIPEVVNVVRWLKSSQDLKDKVMELENLSKGNLC